MITYISPINMVAENNHLYFAYKSPLGLVTGVRFLRGQSLILVALIRQPFISSQAFFISVNLNVLHEQY